jgi:hypothetical protein
MLLTYVVREVSGDQVLLELQVTGSLGWFYWDQVEVVEELEPVDETRRTTP